MQVVIQNVYFSTWIIETFLIIAILVSLRRKDESGLLSPSVSSELKGFAILGVLFCHIGYFLVTDPRFLFPLSNIAGICVDLFLFLSGFGLTIGALTKGISWQSFYKKNLARLYVPFLISLVLFFIASFTIAHVYYPTSYIFKSLLGIFASANIYQDINSPLWYFTVIIFYYLLFPLIFSKKYPWATAAGIFFITLFITKLNLQSLSGVNGLQSLHIFAFPMGILIGSMYEKITIKTKNKSSYMNSVLCIITFFVCAYYSGKVADIYMQQIINIIAVLSLVFVFAMKKFRFGFLSLLGLYSYEIYLIHWPILYHYDIFYRYTPAWLATTLYIALFLGFGFLLKKVSERILKVL